MGGLGSGPEVRAVQNTPGGGWKPLGFSIPSRYPHYVCVCGGGWLRTHFQKKPTPFLHLGLRRAACICQHTRQAGGPWTFLGTWAGVCGTG